MAEIPCSSVLGIMISEPSPIPSSSAGGDDSPPVMPEDLFCRRLSRFGQSIGLFVYLFCASQVTGGSPRLINGFRLKHGRWQHGSFPLPDVLYDRSLPRTNAQYKEASCALAELKRLKPYILLNGSLPGKLDVYRELERDSQLSPWLPSTYKYEGASDLTQLMKHYPEGLFLKPSAGSHGKGALRLLRRDDGWHIDGRDRKNRPLAVIYDNWQDVCRWIHRFVASLTYIVQPYLPLTGKDGRSYDVRVLIQKDESGKWSFTGAAVRTGQRGSVTANLHGGGSAQGALEALTEQFDSETAGRLLGRMRWISERAAAALENHFGRLAELGIDYGIEQGGRIWLLEANAKPGRKALEGDESAARLAVERPIRYSMKLAAHRQPVYQFGRNQRRYIQEVHP